MSKDITLVYISYISAGVGSSADAATGGAIDTKGRAMK
jgi:hypothetical protein